MTTAVYRLVTVAIILAAGCEDAALVADAALPPVPDAAPTDTAVPDAPSPDATAPIDALAPCPGRLLFTGEYVDWDSSDSAFQGIFDATLSERAESSNTASTAPNGRGILCLRPDVDPPIVDIRHRDYLPLVVTASAPALQGGPFATRGLTPDRRATLYADDLMLSADAARATVLVELRRYPGGVPVIGATVALSLTHDGAFTAGADGVLAPGSATTDTAYVLFANATPAGSAGDATPALVGIAVMPPAGITCVGPDALAVEANALSAALYACE